MKRRSVGKSANMYVMFALLAVLFVSLGYLSMQGKREGMEEPPSAAAAAVVAAVAAKKKEPMALPGMASKKS